MSYKTILVHCDANPKATQRLAVAVDLAERHKAHLVGVNVKQLFDMPAFFDGPLPANLQRLQEFNDRVSFTGRQRLEREARRLGLTRMCQH